MGLWSTVGELMRRLRGLELTESHHQGPRVRVSTNQYTDRLIPHNVSESGVHEMKASRPQATLPRCMC